MSAPSPTVPDPASVPFPYEAPFAALIAALTALANASRRRARDPAAAHRRRLLREAAAAEHQARDLRAGLLA